MKKYYVFFRNKLGTKSTPMLVTASNKRDAVSEGRKRSRLSDFPKVWNLKISEL